MSPEKKIRGLLIQTGRFPQEIEIGTGLRPLQNAVGGYIETVYLLDGTCCLVCNEEAKLKGLPYNRSLKESNGRVYDVVAGDFLILGVDEDEFCSLTDEQFTELEKEFHYPEVFVML